MTIAGLPVITEIGADGPDVDGVLQLHRAPDSWVRFLHRVDPQDDDLSVIPQYGSIQVSKLRGMFPEIINWLVQDGYYTVNSFWRGATQATSDVRYLNAVFSDLDHRGITSGQAIGTVVDLMDTQVIPAPSMLARSGRGLWLFYVLDDEKHPGRGQRAYRGGQELALYLSVNCALNQKLTLHHPELGADANALDASRITRVPGSLNTASMSRVRYVILADASGRSPMYTLTQLADFFGIDTRPRRMYPRRIKSANREPKKIAGRLSVYAGRLEEFQLLRAHRNGFREGHRNFAAMLYAMCLKAANDTDPEIEDEVIQLGRECRDASGLRSKPLSRRECVKAAQSGIKRWLEHKKFENATIAARLGITADEVRYLRLEKLRPDFKYRPETGTRKEKQEKRRRAIREIIDECGGDVPSTRKMIAALAGRGAPTAAPATISADYRALGLSKKPPPADPQRELFE